MNSYDKPTTQRIVETLDDGRSFISCASVDADPDLKTWMETAGNGYWQRHEGLSGYVGPFPKSRL